jgi:formylglycine-generating enzyme required for sulfatase activity
VVAGCGGGNVSPIDVAHITTDGGSGTDEVGHSRCPAGLSGPDLVLVKWNDGIAFCIDSSEVTNAQYAAFLAAPKVPPQAARCAWNQTFAPESMSTNGPMCPKFDPTARPDYPVVCIDWCDANTYCQWAGKRLCQKPGGGSVGEDWTTKNASEWVIACTGDGARRYPYGNSPTTGLCVDRHYPMTTAALLPVKPAAMCQGGVSGLFDMSGNAWEWQDDCVEQSTGDGTKDACAPLGGSFTSELAASTCIDGALFFRNQVAGDAGFRCCADAVFGF